MAERTVKLGSMFYIDDKGTPRRGQEGEKIQVSSDFVKKFDALNHLATLDDVQVHEVAPEAPHEEAPEEKPKARGRPRKAESE
jgi:hypothetical protein